MATSAPGENGYFPYEGGGTSIEDLYRGITVQGPTVSRGSLAPETQQQGQSSPAALRSSVASDSLRALEK